MRYWLTKSSYNGEYVIWSSKPTPVYSKHMDDVLYTDGDVVARGLYEFDEIFPTLKIEAAGMIEIEIDMSERGGEYIIRRVNHEGTRSKDEKQTP